jgi:hypothetical protein
MGCMPKDSFGHRAAANIARAYEQNGLHQLLEAKKLAVLAGNRQR